MKRSFCCDFGEIRYGLAYRDTDSLVLKKILTQAGSYSDTDSLVYIPTLRNHFLAASR